MIPDVFDVIVIGGGVNGTGVARDCAMRKLKTALVEKKDFAAGSSGANSGMIHGGIRYLSYDPSVTHDSCVDSGYIQRIAPHLLFRIPFILPFPRHARSDLGLAFERGMLYATECYFEAYDRYQPYKNGMPHTRLSPAETQELEPGIIDDIHGSVTMDEWGIDPFRLCTLNARSARDAGATVLTRTEVLGLMRDPDGKVLGVETRDLMTGQKRELRARLVFNCGGPWAPKIGRLANVEVKMRPGKGVHLTLDRRLSNYGVICYAVDGRMIFVMPHESSSIIGTTDDDFYGDPDDLKISQDEVAYLLEGVASVFPRVREARILRTWAGVRPTLHKYGVLEDQLSREHAIYDGADQGAPGLMTMIGGKLASFRHMAQHATDVICEKLGHSVRECRTHLEPLPGGEARVDAHDLAMTHEVPEYSAARLAYRYGAEAPKVLALCQEEPALRANICPCEGVMGAELVYALRNEMCHGLTDLRRRCRLAMGSCQGARCIGPAASIMAAERRLNPDEAHKEILDLLAERWKGERPVLAGEGMAQAELTLSTYFTVDNLDRLYGEGV